ncbi:MAG TPA: hypothetical protein VMU33_03965 [Burkholderiaceae bacterium]|nr:hypothetical protein [Burkholderiaceae bacterium]
MNELAGCVRQLRLENRQLRAALGHANSEVESMRQRVETATARLDVLIGRLPPAPGAEN